MSEIQQIEQDLSRYRQLEGILNTLVFHFGDILQGLEEDIDRSPQDRDRLLTAYQHNRDTYDGLVEHLEQTSKIIDSLLEERKKWISEGAPEREMKGSGATKIQALIFSNDIWTKKKADKWFKDHGFKLAKNKKVHTTKNFIRYRVMQPNYNKYFHRKKVLGNGINAIIAISK